MPCEGRPGAPPPRPPRIKSKDMYVDVTPQNKVDGRAADAAADGSLFGLLVNSFGC